MTKSAEPPELLVAGAGAWRRWLEANHAGSAGVRLVLARKGAGAPTTLTYDQALLEALCFGWIDGRGGRRDETSYTVRFQPRRPRSQWSQRNVGLAEQLIAEGRMAPAGLAEIERARSDGRWAEAYGGPATIAVPEDLAEAVAASPAAAEAFAGLSSQNRYAFLYRLQTAKRPETRARRIRTYVEMLERGETFHPQRTK
jgi:uncharacterized protein YdeI (YjbR/CyaY-like superfamily)